ncbi:MauE/DoxX family redox-associated membrane protein [Deminuibacter soli]|uniref:MauE/DoxX family redox-associated membrane protein n=1 Tax=Deminuibacter soli TaxID=2291815 RepID=UPI0011C18159|nr:MauE/DoxX family redox-associated membrane protein [Deminuibacter soli]
MKKTTFLELLCVLFAFLFFYTGIVKYLDYTNFSYDLRRSYVFGPFSNVASILLPAAELAISAGLFIPRFRSIALYCFTFMMAAFTLYVGGMLIFVDHASRPCTCGGIIRDMSWPQHLVFNIVVTLLGIIAIYLHKKTYRKTGTAELTTL